MISEKATTLIITALIALAVVFFLSMNFLSSNTTHSIPESKSDVILDESGEVSKFDVSINTISDEVVSEEFFEKDVFVSKLEQESILVENPETLPAPILTKESQSIAMCNKSENKSKVVKPTGVFTSVITEKAIKNGDDIMQGGLIRVEWAQLEPNPGQFDFSSIEKKLAILPLGKKWSLAVHGGWTSVDKNDPDLYGSDVLPNGAPRSTIQLNMSPKWLVSDFGVDTFEMEFRRVTVNMPKYWDTNLQNRLKILMTALAVKYGSDPRLQLVYVPQMTSNGVEGHFNGVPDITLLDAADITAEDNLAKEKFAKIWVKASLDASHITAEAFINKAIAFEVHEVLGSASIPKSIMDTFIIDSSFGNRVGIAMWWISGRDTYQSDLVSYISEYTGDLYGQVIGNSSQTERYLNGDYSEVFSQAKDLCMRYVEPWNYEFENNTQSENMIDFNVYTSKYFK